MANFGKRAKLECQKGTTGVECLVSVYGRTDGADGEPIRYRVIVQRLQDQVRVEDAEAGLADALPFITNRKQWFQDEEGNNKVGYSHYDFISADMMEAIRKAAKNCYVTKEPVETEPGDMRELEVENYCVRLNIGFNLGRGEAFFYRIKSGVNRDSLAKDIKYNLRHMPAEGRALTAAILEGHREVTDVAYRVYMDSLSLGKKGGADDAGK